MKILVYLDIFKQYAPFYRLIIWMTSNKKTKELTYNDQKKKEFECNSLNWDIKMCLKNKKVAHLFVDKSEEQVLEEMTKFISRQSRHDTYVSYQKGVDAKNLYQLWANYPTQTRIFFVYHLIGVCNPNIGLAIKSLKTSDSGWSKNVKGMEDSKRNWNFMNKLIWKTNSLDTFGTMYKALIDNEVDPWALNVEQEDAFGSFIFKMFKINKKGDPEQEQYFLKMLSTTSSIFIENKTQVILNKACQNYNIFESRLKYLCMSDMHVFQITLFMFLYMQLEVVLHGPLHIFRESHGYPQFLRYLFFFHLKFHSSSSFL